LAGQYEKPCYIPALDDFAERYHIARVAFQNGDAFGNTQTNQIRSGLIGRLSARAKHAAASREQKFGEIGTVLPGYP
jgi:hypothetical protein